MDGHDHLTALLARLKLTAMRDQLDTLIDEAGRRELTIREALTLFCEREVARKDQRRIDMAFGLARFPFVRDLTGFDFGAQPSLDKGQVREIATGRFIANGEAVLLLGPPGVGKTHLAVALCVAACRQRRRVRFTTATALVKELSEAAHANALSRALGRYERLDLICIDELGYVPLTETACELMFQVIADRAEKAAVIVTTNLPFSEWPQVIPNAHLCKALIDRLTDRAHIITTGTESYRFRRTTAQRKTKS